MLRLYLCWCVSQKICWCVSQKICTSFKRCFIQTRFFHLPLVYLSSKQGNVVVIHLLLSALTDAALEPRTSMPIHKFQHNCCCVVKHEVGARTRYSTGVPKRRGQMAGLTRAMRVRARLDTAQPIRLTKWIMMCWLVDSPPTKHGTIY